MEALGAPFEQLLLRQSARVSVLDGSYGGHANVGALVPMKHHENYLFRCDINLLHLTSKSINVTIDELTNVLLHANMIWRYVPPPPMRAIRATLSSCSSLNRPLQQSAGV
jgi:hypothetical protein